MWEVLVRKYWIQILVIYSNIKKARKRITNYQYYKYSINLHNKRKGLVNFIFFTVKINQLTFLFLGAFLKKLICLKTVKRREYKLVILFTQEITSFPCWWSRVRSRCKEVISTFLSWWVGWFVQCSAVEMASYHILLLFFVIKTNVSFIFSPPIKHISVHQNSSLFIYQKNCEHFFRYKYSFFNSEPFFKKSKNFSPIKYIFNRNHLFFQKFHYLLMKVIQSLLSQWNI